MQQKNYTGIALMNESPLNSTGADQDDDEIIEVQSREPTEKELFYLEWGKEMVKNQFNLANELLKQLITLCVALLSVSVIFDKLFETEPKLKFLAVLLFFLSLIAACAGIFPFERQNVWLNSPSMIERFKRDALFYKKICYIFSGLFMAFGIGVILIQVFREAF